MIIPTCKVVEAVGAVEKVNETVRSTLKIIPTQPTEFVDRLIVAQNDQLNQYLLPEQSLEQVQGLKQ